MKPAKTNTPALDDATVKEATGKTLKQWYKVLDDLGGPDVGRRNLIQKIYDDCRKDTWWSITIVVEYEGAKGVREKDGLKTGYGICATKTMAATPAKVFAAFADARRWKDWFGTNAKADPKEGGKFACDDGDCGTFKKLREGKDAKLTWENPRHAGSGPVEIKFDSKPGDKCVMMVNHNRIQTREQADELRESWLAALEKLKTIVEG